MGDVLAFRMLLIRNSLNEANVIVFFNNHHILFWNNTSFDPITHGLGVGNIKSLAIFCDCNPIVQFIFHTIFGKIILRFFERFSAVKSKVSRFIVFIRDQAYLNFTSFVPGDNLSLRRDQG